MNLISSPTKTTGNVQTIQQGKADSLQGAAMQQGTSLQSAGLLPQGATIVKVLNPGTGNVG